MWHPSKKITFIWCFTSAPADTTTLTSVFLLIAVFIVVSNRYISSRELGSNSAEIQASFDDVSNAMMRYLPPSKCLEPLSACSLLYKARYSLSCRDVKDLEWFLQGGSITSAVVDDGQDIVLWVIFTIKKKRRFTGETLYFDNIPKSTKIVGAKILCHVCGAYLRT